MMAIAVGGNASGDAPAGDSPAGAAAGGDAADETNVVANDAAGGAAEAPQVPQSPPISPVREPTSERQPTSERPLSPPPSSPETEWVVPDPVSPVADWRPWPYVHVHFSKPESPPFPPEQTFLYEEPVKFGPVPRPTGFVDPDDIEPIFFGPQPRPMDYVEPDFKVPIFFGPQPRPDNYVEPEEPDVIISMEDDTIHGGFHVKSPVRSNDAPKPTADVAGRAEDPSMLTILSDKLDRCMGRIATLEKDLGTSKQVMGGTILKLVNRVKRLENQAHLRRRKLVIADSDKEAEVAAELDAVHEEHSSCSGLDKREDCIHIYRFFISYSGNAARTDAMPQAYCSSLVLSACSCWWDCYWYYGWYYNSDNPG
nr:hypothetical protein [Tanacetum cinerariifolium]